MSKIEWCDITINPVVGCKKCSPGCDNCYAEKFAYRLSLHPNPKIREKYRTALNGKEWNGSQSKIDLQCFKLLPKNPKFIFVGSMSDLFLNCGMDTSINMMNILQEIVDNPQHTFLMLTKRAENMKEFFRWAYKVNRNKVVKNLWLGVTACTQDEFDKNCSILKTIPAIKHFVSIEPMLEDFKHIFPALIGIDWVILGGETGKKARPLKKEWAESIQMNCEIAKIPFFFKGFGEYAFTNNEYLKVGKKTSGRLLNGKEYIEFPI